MMPNYPMQNKLKNNEAVDVSDCPLWMDRYYDVTKVFRGIDIESDYCDAKKERWIWSIGKHNKTGNIYASTSPDLYLNPDFECLWLR